MPRLAAQFLQHGDSLEMIAWRRSGGRTLLAVGLTLVILAACGDDDSSDSSSTSSTSASTSSTTSGTESDVTGIWVGTWAIDPPYEGSAGEFTMQLVQTGGSFNGTVTITNTDCPTGNVSGTVAGTTVTFDWLLDETVSFTGELDGSSMSGTWESIACSDPNILLTGTFEATKS